MTTRRRLLKLLTSPATADLDTLAIARLAGVPIAEAQAYRDEFDEIMRYAGRELVGCGLKIMRTSDMLSAESLPFVSQ